MPEAMPPVRPTKNIFPGKRCPETAEPGAEGSLERKASVADGGGPPEEHQKDLPGRGQQPNQFGPK